MPNTKKTTVNLVSQFDEEELKKIGNKVYDDYHNDLQSRSEWERKRNKWYKLWACERDEKNTPWPNASNVCIPMLSTAVNQFHARSYQSIFAAPGFVKAIPVGKLDHTRSKLVEAFMNWQINYEMEEYEEVMDKLLLQLPIDGVAFKKIFYDVENERPRTEYIPALDLVLPYRTKSLATARRITHRLWLHYDELQDRDDLGLYENFEKISDTAAQKTEGTITQDTADKITGVSSTRAVDEPHLILECHTKLLIDGKREPVIITIDEATQTVLRITSRVFKIGKKQKVLNYFRDYHFLPNPEGFYSFGLGHFVEQLNEMANTAFNQIFDSGRLTNQPWGFYGRKAGIRAKKLKLYPGLMTEVADAGQVSFPQMQKQDGVLFQVIGLTQQFVETFTSTSDYILGRENQGTQTPTARGTLALIEQGLVVFSVMTKRIFRSLKGELGDIFALNQIFLPDGKEFVVMEGEDRIPFPDIKRKDFNHKYHINPVADPAYSSRTARKQEALELYQAMIVNPLIAGNPGAGMSPNFQAIHALTKNLINTFQITNAEEILPAMPQQSISPVDENAMFMQGDARDPVPGENHEQHLQVHATFRQGAFYSDMKAEYKELFETHITKTKQLMLLEQERAKVLGEQENATGQKTQGGAGGIPASGGESIGGVKL